MGEKFLTYRIERRDEHQERGHRRQSGRILRLGQAELVRFVHFVPDVASGGGVPRFRGLLRGFVLVRLLPVGRVGVLGVLSVLVVPSGHRGPVVPAGGLRGRRRRPVGGSGGGDRVPGVAAAVARGTGPRAEQTALPQTLALGVDGRRFSSDRFLAPVRFVLPDAR